MSGTTVTSAEAARLVGVAPDSFRAWARRRRLVPVKKQRRGSRTVALYDADAVLDAQSCRPNYQEERA